MCNVVASKWCQAVVTVLHHHRWLGPSLPAGHGPTRLLPTLDVASPCVVLSYHVRDEIWENGVIVSI